MELKKMKSFSIQLENKTEDELLFLPLFDYNLDNCDKVKFSAFDDDGNEISYMDFLKLLQSLTQDDNSFPVCLTYLQWDKKHEDNPLFSYSRTDSNGKQNLVPFHYRIDPEQMQTNICAVIRLYSLSRYKQLILNKLFSKQTVRLKFCNHIYLPHITLNDDDSSLIDGDN